MNSNYLEHVSPGPVDQPKHVPMVSIGLPVRDGAPFLDEALRLLRQQTHPHLEIIVSDNASSDGSTEIIQRHAAEDKRIRVYRHEVPLTALANFRYVFEQTNSDFFMWAACDDRRSLDYVEKLLVSLQQTPEASLAFCKVAEFSDMQSWRDTPAMAYFFETLKNEPLLNRLIRYSTINCLHIYGLIRRSALATYQWIDIDNGPDMPLLIHLSFAGEFINATGGQFYFYRPLSHKTMEERAIANSLRKLRPFPEMRLAWACAATAHRASILTGNQPSLSKAFILVYWHRHWRWIKPWLFEMSPQYVVDVYRYIFKRPPRN